MNNVFLNGKKPQLLPKEMFKPYLFYRYVELSCSKCGTKWILRVPLSYLFQKQEFSQDRTKKEGKL